jgi:SAM-dependent methyltransferase
MPIASLFRDVRKMVVVRATCGGSQNFLGAQWVARVLESTPTRSKEQVALSLLSLSPHYFYDRDARKEAARNRSSRLALANELIAPHVTLASDVIDYGCGPGYMANAMARLTSHVDAVDISPGVLACARVLNHGPNIGYMTPNDLAGSTRMADLAYSFAVAQHLTTDSLKAALSLLAKKIRPGGTLLIHFAVPGDTGWRTEADWKDDRSLAGRVKLRYGMNCFGRSSEEMKELITSCGFTAVVICSLADTFASFGDDDIMRQKIATATRLADQHSSVI